MTIPNIINEWRKGCSCAPEDAPEECAECTKAAIQAIENEHARMSTIGECVGTLIQAGHSVEIVPVFKRFGDTVPISHSVKVPTLAFLGSVPFADLPELLKMAVDEAQNRSR